MTEPTVSPLGDSAITLTFGEGISADLNDRVVAEAKRITAARIHGVRDVVPSYASLTVHYDPLRITYADLRAQLSAVPMSATQRETQSRLHLITVDYNGEDLDDVARRTKLSSDDVISIHSSIEYRVFVIGFVPGFAYLGPLDQRLVLPRRESPRKRVPAGSVAIAEAQTGIYPAETPGGWHLIGISETNLFDARREQPSLFAVGDTVRFKPA
ncbi:MAG TPA: 5-oxoprolinase subunit PxpB [Gemmatimonadaceae bacterium]